MASDSAPSQEGKKRKKKSDRAVKSKDSSAVVRPDIEELTATGHSALQRGDGEEALSCFKKAFKASIELKEGRVQRACAFNLGAAYVEAGRPEKGLHFLTRGQPGEESGGGERVADLQFNLAAAHDALGEPRPAAGYYLQAAQLYRSQGDGASEGDTCVKMARCHVRLQEWSAAAESYQRAGESYRVAGKLEAAAFALKEAGGHMLQCDDVSTDDVIGVLAECLELSDNIKDPESLAGLYNDLGLSFSQLKLFPEAVGCYERALPLSGATPTRLAAVLQNLGAAHNALGQYGHALPYHTQAAARHGSLGSRRAQGRCFSNLGFALVQMGRHEEAVENYLHALQAFKDTDDHRGQCQVYEVLGEAQFKLRDLEKATLYYKQALGALSQCKDSSSAVQDRLVNKLSEALQHRLSLTTAGRKPRGTGPRRHTQNGIGPGQHALRTDMKRRNLSNGHRAENGLLVGGAGSVGGVHAVTGGAEPDSPLRGAAGEHSGRTTVEANRNLNNTYQPPDTHYQDQDLSDPHYQDQDRLNPHYEDQDLSDSPGDAQGELSDSSNVRTAQRSSEIPLVQGSEAPPTGALEKEDAATLFKKWKSRICTVM